MFSFVLRHEGQLFKTLLSDYEARQRELLLENAELNKVLQQMKGEITSILRSNKSNLTGDKYKDDVTQVVGDWVPRKITASHSDCQLMAYVLIRDVWTLVVVLFSLRRRRRKCWIPIKKVWSCFVFTPVRSSPTVFAFSGENSRTMLNDWTVKVPL